MTLTKEEVDEITKNGSSSDLSDKIAADMAAKFGYKEAEKKPVPHTRPVMDAQGQVHESISAGCRIWGIDANSVYRKAKQNNCDSTEAFLELTKELNDDSSKRPSRTVVPEHLSDGESVEQAALPGAQPAEHGVEPAKSSDGAQGEPAGESAGRDGGTAQAEGTIGQALKDAVQLSKTELVTAATINHPSHYDECNINVIYKPIDLEKWYPAYIFSAMKYLFRFKYKDGDKDLLKAIRYLLWWAEQGDVISAVKEQCPPITQYMLIEAYRAKYEWLEMLIDETGKINGGLGRVVAWACEHLKSKLPKELEDEIVRCFTPDNQELDYGDFLIAYGSRDR